MYDLPKIKITVLEIKKTIIDIVRNRIFQIISLIVFVSILLGIFIGAFLGVHFYSQAKIYLEKIKLGLHQQLEGQLQPETKKEYIPKTSQEEAVINAVKENSPAVVSIIISKNVPIMEEYFYNPFENLGPLAPNIQIPQYRKKGTEKKEIGGGTGFIISSDGTILTNKHVVSETDAEYAVFTNDGKKYDATILAKDPVQDLGILKIDQKNSLDKEGGATSESFPTVKLGDSNNLQIGQSVIAIGNALGEFRNTVSVGVISGLGRTISASGGGVSETLEDIIQTDAAINQGNSGGPLLNLKGEVIGINTAVATDAQSIGFAIPINKAKRDIDQIKKTSKISYPFLGVRYVLVNEEVKQKENLSVDYGALILKGASGEVAVTSGSAADKAGLKEGDIILEFNGEKITRDNSLAKIISEYNPGDKITLKILRDKEEKNINVVLGERSE
jgi:serine protease Do